MSSGKKITILALLIVIVIISSVFLWLELYKNNIESFASVKQSEISKIEKKPEIKSEKKTISILFLGDLMADRYIRQTIDKKGVDYIFSGTRDLLKSEDLVVANLEGPITNNNSISVNTIPGERSHLIFTFDPSLAPILAQENIKVVNIGNNHIANFGADGKTQTKESLEKNNIEYFGDTGENEFLIKEIGGIKIGFVNYNQFFSGSLDRTLENIKNVRLQADIVVVYTHWGTEYKTELTENIKNLGRKFIDDGADLVIGTHPHVVEPMEEYKGKRIYYSLGNYIFDQYFSQETKKGLAVEVGIDAQTKKMKFNDINLKLETNGQTSINTL